MFVAKSIMSTEMITVTEETPLYDAMALLVNNSITGIPVVSSDGTLTGIVSEKDMLELLYNADMGKATVGEVMTRDVVYFQDTDDLVDVCEAMLKGHFRRVPILSKGRLVGLISRSDIIRFIIKLRRSDRREEV